LLGKYVTLELCDFFCSFSFVGSQLALKVKEFRVRFPARVGGFRVL